MNENFNSNNIPNNEFSHNTEDCDYKKLTSRLKNIRETIALLEKQFLDKF